MAHETDDHGSDADQSPTDSEWRSELSDEEYRILREAGTEPPFSGEFVDHNADGSYVCAGCGAELFDSETKFESGCGWPSFYDTDDDRIETRLDTSNGMRRTEVLCGNCGGHLGHVFDDGPDPTGKRYCINSVALDFDAE
ncbi:peptide-methionine (R)-S-oxide reductase MsrB [Natronorubrum thiooxidans]|uniref:peptide-methionine (R)-S-oxide reductase n=1 Tax=Natronorubrum thiooxidans TaxID=308853 RepID=A0A1N7C4I3_9EURY|nr:peptide-methionine (R)-S-oxide reductase MsrB [Natronorubrum thiooxidans]SIR58498.1 peptide-methionine (R)-S-oxide reductase [Natronorubrum thiooxidans]